MGQQMLTSAASFMFKECKEVPEYFNVTDEDLKSHFPDGASIESEIAVSCFRNLVFFFAQFLVPGPRPGFSIMGDITPWAFCRRSGGEN